MQHRVNSQRQLLAVRGQVQNALLGAIRLQAQPQCQRPAGHQPEHQALRLQVPQQGSGENQG